MLEGNYKGLTYYAFEMLTGRNDVMCFYTSRHREILDEDKKFNLNPLVDNNFSLSFESSSDPSAISANRALVAEMCGIEPCNLICTNQTHGDEIVLLEQSDFDALKQMEYGCRPSFDGIITALRHTSIMALNADCPLVALYHPDQHIIGVVHSGWRGTYANVVGKALDIFLQLGASPCEVLACISPSICGTCYTVGDDLVEKFETEESPLSAFIAQDDVGNHHLMLTEAITNQLIESGVEIYNIEVSQLCSSCNNDEFFSYRKEKESAGRNALVMMLR